MDFKELQSGFEGELYKLSDVSSRLVSTSIAKELNDIRNGLTEDRFGWNWIV